MANDKKKPCDHVWVSSEGRTSSGVLCSKCGDYQGPAAWQAPPAPEQCSHATWNKGVCDDCGTVLNPLAKAAGASKEQALVTYNVRGLDIINGLHFRSRTIRDEMAQVFDSDRKKVVELANDLLLLDQTEKQIEANADYVVMRVADYK